MNWRMGADTAIPVLTDHKIEYCIIKGRIEALDISVTASGREAKWIDITDWSYARLMRWLGY